MGWAPLITAPDQLIAESWQELLRREGIPSLIRPQDAISFLGLSTLPCLLLVPQGMVPEAKAILSQYRDEDTPFNPEEEP